MNVLSSDSIGFFGQKVIELFFTDKSILVEVSSFKHFLEGVVVSKFSQIFSNSSQIFQSDEA